MRKSAKIITALSVAGLAVAAGSAFTASNTMPAGSVSGYGQTVSTGATITAVTFSTLAADKSKLENVVFTSTTDLTGKSVSLTLKSGTTVVGSPYSCTFTDYTAGSSTVTCNTADNPLLNAFDTTGLTVL